MEECIGTTTTSILVNGSSIDEFPLERGLRQDDHLSPFLFLLAAEGLHVMMTTMVESNIFTGYRVGMHPPTIISLLQFVDDALLLGVKSWSNVRLCTLFLLIFK